MPKKRGLQREAVHVTGIIKDFNGKPVEYRRITISLPVACTWRGNIMEKKQQSSTDANGRFEFWLPPTSELRPVKSRGKIEYTIICEGIGSWAFIVPDDISEMNIGDEKTGGKS